MTGANVEKVKLTIISNDTTHATDIFGEHGLSIFINAILTTGDSVKILFDTGNHGEIVSHNIDVLGIDIKNTDMIVISHGHYDHTGGLLTVLEKIGKKIPVILHPDALLPKFALKPRLRYTGIPFDPKDLYERAVILKSKKSLEITPGIIVTGEVPRVTEYEKVTGYFIQRDEQLEPEIMLDDQAIILKMEDGTIGIITGCSHSGIVNIANYAIELTGNNNIKFIIGGFHLIGASKERLDKTWKDLLSLNPIFVSPIHCSGSKIVSKIHCEAPDRFLPLFAGSSITF
ncbi:MAG: MBL fold metallo-hydrolase [Candidatus Njordarchaeia archaeon]|nr:MBL fold metallo-hydrolase [Candidatus Korarchaeota archaeon]